MEQENNPDQDSSVSSVNGGAETKGETPVDHTVQADHATTPDAAAPADNSASAPPKKKSLALKIILIVVGVLVVLVVGFFLIVNLASGGAKKVSDEFIADIQQTKSEQAYNLFSSKAKKVVAADQFDKTVKQIGPILSSTPKVLGKEASSSSDKGTTSKITYEIEGTDGITYKVTVELIKEDSNWRVLNFDSNKKDQ